MTNAQFISLCLIEKMALVQKSRGTHQANAAVLRETIDSLLGAGTYDKLVSDVYDELRARAA